MASTPPPATRARTPPTPLHGPRYDAYEPYSPRRSSRLVKHHGQESRLQHAGVNGAATPSRKPRQIVGSSSSGSRPSLARTASQTYSPPPSPGRASPGKTSPVRTSSGRNSTTREKSKNSMAMRQEPESAQKAVRFGLRHDDDAMQLSSDHEGDLLRADNLDAQANNLPTPRKTPRNKRISSSDTDKTQATARVLFPNRSNELDEIMPSPRRARKGRKLNAFTLESFAEDGADADEIPIYTDSKERVPDLDTSADNPFSTSTSRARGRPPKTKYGLSKEIDRAVDNNEGMVYVFRGKKFFRKFDDATPLPSEAEPTSTSPEDATAQIQRNAGATAGRPFRRSRITPRKLFVEEIAQRRAEEGEDPEEMTTDIEGDADTQSNTRVEGSSHTEAGVSSYGKAAAEDLNDRDEKATTPVKKHFSQIATPPTTAHKGHARTLFTASTSGLDSSVDAGVDTGDAAQGQRKRSPFDSWARGKTAKRQGEPLDKDEGEAGTPKRTRSRVTS